MISKPNQPSCWSLSIKHKSLDIFLLQRSNTILLRWWFLQNLAIRLFRIFSRFLRQYCIPGRSVFISITYILKPIYPFVRCNSWIPSLLSFRPTIGNTRFTFDLCHWSALMILDLDCWSIHSAMACDPLGAYILVKSQAFPLKFFEVRFADSVQVLILVSAWCFYKLRVQLIYALTLQVSLWLVTYLVIWCFLFYSMAVLVQFN